MEMVCQIRDWETHRDQCRALISTAAVVLVKPVRACIELGAQHHSETPLREESETPGKSSALLTRGSARAILHLHISENPNTTTTMSCYTAERS